MASKDVVYCDSQFNRWKFVHCSYCDKRFRFGIDGFCGLGHNHHVLYTLIMKASRRLSSNHLHQRTTWLGGEFRHTATYNAHSSSVDRTRKADELFATLRPVTHAPAVWDPILTYNQYTEKTTS